jgi:hypothetical protein
MRTIIAGSRTIFSHALVGVAVKASGFEVTKVLCGGARGVDLAGKMWAQAHAIPVGDYPADWARYGKAAGAMRNIEMAKNADALIAVWDGESRGTKHMIRIATERGLKVFVHRVPCKNKPEPVDIRSKTHDPFGHELPEEAAHDYLL